MCCKDPIAPNDPPPPDNPSSKPNIIDHMCMDISKIPPEYITVVKENLSIHIAGRSHAFQVSGFGMDELSDNSGGASGNYYYVQNNTDTPQLNNDRIDITRLIGSDAGIEPHEYFGGTGDNVNWDRSQGAYPIETYLDDPSHSLINIAVFGWCGELAVWTDNKEYVEGYLYAMNNLEQMYAPGGIKGRTEETKVVFVYMTSHTQKHEGDNGDGNDRQGAYSYLANERIREYCLDNNKILFDFGDMDSWGLTDGQGSSFDNFDPNGIWELSDPRTLSEPNSWDWGGEPLGEVTFYPYHGVWGDMSVVDFFSEPSENNYHTRKEHA